MSSAPQAAEPSTTRFDPRRLFADNPVASAQVAEAKLTAIVQAARVLRAKYG